MIFSFGSYANFKVPQLTKIFRPYPTSNDPTWDFNLLHGAHDLNFFRWLCWCWWWWKYMNWQRSGTNCFGSSFLEQIWPQNRSHIISYSMWPKYYHAIDWSYVEYKNQEPAKISSTYPKSAIPIVTFKKDFKLFLKVSAYFRIQEKHPKCSKKTSYLGSTSWPDSPRLIWV